MDKKKILNTKEENKVANKTVKDSNNPAHLILLGLMLVTIAVLSRFVGHLWNFTLLGGVSLIAGALFNKKSYSFLVVISSLLISDWVIGFHDQMFSVYFSFLLMVVLGSLLKIQSSRLAIVSTSLLGSLLFFLITNFAVWYNAAFYSQTFNGLVQCYLAGIPFFRNQLIADVLSSVVLFQIAKQLLPVWHKSNVEIKM